MKRQFTTSKGGVSFQEMYDSLNEGLPSQYTNKIKGIPTKAFDWFMKYKTEFPTKEFGFKKLNMSKVSVNSSALTDRQKGRIVTKLGFKNHKSQASALEKLIVSVREKWSDIQTIAHMETYGEKPGFGAYKVSGIGDSKYSDTHKKELRTLAHMETVFKNALGAHKAVKNLSERGPADRKFKTDKIKGHSHLGLTDENGDGKTIKTNGSGSDHTHKVIKDEIQPSGGHTHKFMVMESSTDDAKGTLQAIIGTLKKGDGNSDMLKMANGIMDFFKKEGSFSPDQAKWIWKTSVALFKESVLFEVDAEMTEKAFKKLIDDIKKKASELATLQKKYRGQTGRELRV